MGTTSGELGLAALDALSRAGVEYGLLHGRESLDTGAISDIDIVVGEAPQSAVARARSSWADYGLTPILISSYDVGGAAAVFLATRDAREGVQLDMLFDPHGVGMYGLLSGRLLETVAASSHTPVVSDVARLVYLWRKATVKRQTDRLNSVALEASKYSREQLDEVIVRLTGVKAGVDRFFVTRDRIHERNPRYRFRQVPRLIDRVLNPVGFWSHVRRADVASELARRVSGFLVLARSTPVPSLARQAAWYPRVVFPVLLRPGAVFTWGNTRRFLVQPNLIVDCDDLDGAAELFVNAMSKRAIRCES
jgi:hypothetical protein